MITARLGRGRSLSSVLLGLPRCYQCNSTHSFHTFSRALSLHSLLPKRSDSKYGNKRIFQNDRYPALHNPQQSRFFSDRQQSSRSPEASKNFRIKWYLLVATLVGSITYWYLFEGTNEPKNFNTSDQYLPFKLIQKEMISPSTALFTFECPTPMDPFHPVSSISIKDPTSNIQRPYTLVSADSRRLTVLVKRYPDGEISKYIHSRTIDQEVYIRLARPVYVLPDPVPKDLVMIVGGTSISVAFQLVDYLVTSVGPVGMPKCSVLYASLSADEVYLQSEFKDLVKRSGGKVVVQSFVDADGTFITADAIRPLLNRDGVVLVCGSDGFTEYIAGSEQKAKNKVGGLLGDLKFAGEIRRL